LALLLPVALLLGGAAGGAPLHAQRPRSSSSCSGGDCEAMRDYVAELAKLRAEVAALVRQQAKLQATQKRGEEMETLQDQIRYATRKLSRLQSRLSKDKDTDSRAESSALIAQLDQQLRQLGERQAQLAQQGQIAQEFARTPRAQGRGQGVSTAALRGYIGVVYTSQGSQTIRNGEVYVNHPDYPVVESVEPGSPAERAGMVSGDTIIAYNRRDVRNREIPLTDLLTPGAKVLVTVRRDGRVRTVPVLVADRSENPEYGEWNGSASTAPPAAPPVRVRVATPVTPAAPLAPPATAVVVGGRSSLVLAGAEFMRMNDDLREFFDVRGGVLVYSVGARTMAAQAGLRGGDVVVRVNDNKVNTPDDLERVVARGGDRTARLTVVRKGREQVVNLRW